jgi:hypothetical protein
MPKLLAGLAITQTVMLVEVLDGIPLAPALAAPVAGFIGMRPDPKAIFAATPGARAGILTAMGAGCFAKGSIATDEIEQGHRYPILSHL